MPYANNKGADQPAHPRSLINTFVVRCLDSIIPLVSISAVSSLHKASVAAQAGLCLTWSQTPKTGFLMTWLICPLGFGKQVRLKPACSATEASWSLETLDIASIGIILSNRRTTMVLIRLCRLICTFV